MADKKTEKDSKILDFELAKFVQPDTTKQVGDDQKKVGKMLGRLITLVVIITIMIVVIMIVKNKKVVKITTSYLDKLSKEKAVAKKVAIPATLTWKKKAGQYGADPDMRFGGPYPVIITQDSEENFCFTLRGEKSEANFYGKKKGGVIEGWWKQPIPQSFGNWRLEKDPDDPNLYKGVITDPILKEGVNSELRIEF